MPMPTRDEAITELDKGHAAVEQLCARLSAAQMVRPATIGSGAWSAKDLPSHLAFWEELAVQALADWRAGQRPFAEDLFSQERTDAANADNDERTTRQSLDDVVERAQVAHRAIVAAISTLSEQEWSASPSYADAHAADLGDLLGGVLAAPSGPFQHAAAHLEDLRAYVEAQHGQ